MNLGGANKKDKLTPDKVVNEQKRDYKFVSLEEEIYSISIRGDNK